MLLTVGVVVFGFGPLTVAVADTNPGPGAPGLPAVPATVSADGLPTWQVNGVVWSEVVVGNTVYVTGSFSKARPPGVGQGGVGEIAAANIFAFDITTGTRVASFSHQMNGQGLAIAASSDGSKIFVGGDFTSIDGKARGHVAAFSTATGALDSTFAPSVNGQVRALATAGTTVFAGGGFTSAGGSSRSRLSAFDYSNGSLKPWAPSANDQVWALTMSPDKTRVIAGGRFTTLSGISAYGMGSTDASTGAIMPWAANQTIKDATGSGAITTLRTDGTQIYGAGYAWGANDGSSFEGTFAADPNSGAVKWLNDCHGDTYDVLPVGQVLYSVNHVHDCTSIGDFPDTNPRVWQRATATTTYPTGTNTGPDSYGWDYTGIADSTLLQWWPTMAVGSYTGQSQAAWSLTGNGSYVVAGGEFPTINGVQQQGLVRFAVKALAPNKRGPSYKTQTPRSTPPTVAVSFVAGTARVGFGTAWDMDNETLTYDLLRDNKTWVGTAQIKSNFWTLPASGLIDTGLVAGSTHVYQVRITDPFGNTQWSPISNTVTISSAVPGPYSQAVKADGAASYWRLGEPGGTSVFDHTGFNDASAQAGVSRGTAGAISGDQDPASSFDGSASGYVVTNATVPTTPSFTIEAWVKTTTKSGGKIVGYGDSATGTSGSYDRQVYMGNDGRIWFGVYPGGARTVNSADAYNDGAWHHVVASLDAADGMALYIDGKRVAVDSATKTAQEYSGYWRVGGDSLNGWPNQPSSNFFGGSIDEVAIYPSALSATQVVNHYSASGRTLLNDPPTAAFTTTFKKGVLAADGSGSTDVDGTVASYAWDFGDGSSGTGVTASHNYAIAGTYPVALTVTDNGGAKGTVTHAVTVVPVLPAPTDAYGAAVYQSSPDLYWRLGEASGTTANDASSSGNTGTYQSGVTLGKPGGIAGTTDTAAQFDGQSGLLSSNTSMQGPSTYTEELWFNTTTTNGGKLIGFGDQATGTSNSYDRHIYMENNGQLTFGTYTGQMNTITSPASYNDGQWHHVVATQSSAGMKLYLDGALVGTNPQTAAQDYAGYWRVGSDTTWGPQPYFDGTIDEVAVYYSEALSPATVLSHYTLGATVPANQSPVAAFASSAVNLAASFDGSASSDPDGTVASYAWDFGDNTAIGTGVSASHTYLLAGTYQVKLTVTDFVGATGSVTKAVTVTAPVNQSPTAAFASSSVNLAASFDGSASTDPDGTVASYAWDFGDNTVGSGAKASRTYLAAGTYHVKLTVTDNLGASDSLTKDVTVTAVAANQSPVAAFTSSSVNLAASFDGSASTDPDGTVASYAWDFGDNTAVGTGVFASHTYLLAGTYQVKLTVTDFVGATDSLTKGVTVTAVAGAPFIVDTFARTLASGWGSADTGGAWSGNASSLSVGSGIGKITIANAGNGPAVYLPVTATSADITVTMSSDKVGTGNGVYLSVVGRRVSGAGDYRLQARLRSDGLVGVSILRRDAANAQTVIKSEVTIPGYRFVAGDKLNVHFQVTGTSPTTLKATVWPATTTEPTTWLLTGTDSTTGLQVAGSLGFMAYLSSSGTNAPVTTSFDDLYVRPTTQ